VFVSSTTSRSAAIYEHLSRSGGGGPDAAGWTTGTAAVLCSKCQVPHYPFSLVPDLIQAETSNSTPALSTRRKGSASAINGWQQHSAGRAGMLLEGSRCTICMHASMAPWPAVASVRLLACRMQLQPLAASLQWPPPLKSENWWDDERT